MAIIDVVEIVFNANHMGMVAGIKKVADALGNLENTTKAFGANIDRANHSMVTILNSMEGFTKIGEVLRKPVAAALDFEKSFARISRLVDDKSGVGAFEKSFKGLLTTLPLATDEIKKFAEEAMKAGASTVREFEDLTKLGAQLKGLAGSEGIGPLLTGLIRFTKGFGEGIDKVRETSDVISFLANKFTTTEAEILKATERFAPMAKQLGLTKEQALGLGNALRELNARSEASGTVFAEFFDTMKQASTNAGAELQSFAQTAGTSMEEFARLVREKPIEAFRMFLQGLSDIQAKGGSIVEPLKAIGIEGSRATVVFSQLLGGLKVYDASMASLAKRSKENITTANQAAEVWENLTDKMTILSNAVTLLSADLGKSLLPDISKLVDAAKSLVGSFNDSWLTTTKFGQGLSRLVIETGILAGAITSLTIALNLLGISLAAASVLFIKIGIVIGTLLLIKEAIVSTIENNKILKKNIEETNRAISQDYEKLDRDIQGWVKAYKGNLDEAIAGLKMYIEEMKADIKNQAAHTIEIEKSSRALEKLIALKRTVSSIEAGKLLESDMATPAPSMPVKVDEAADKAKIQLDVNKEITKSLKEHETALEAIRVKYRKSGDDLGRAKAELAAMEKTYKELSKIQPFPTEKLEEFAQTIKLQKEKIDDIKDAKGVEDIGKGFEQRLDVIKEKQAQFGRVTEVVRAEIAATEAALSRYAKVVPVPKEQIAQLTGRLKELKLELATMKDSSQFEQLAAGIERSLKKIDMMGKFFDIDSDKQKLARWRQVLEDTIDFELKMLEESTKNKAAKISISTNVEGSIGKGIEESVDKSVAKVSGYISRAPAQIAALIQKYASQYAVDPRLVEAIMKQESGFNQNAVSPVGARGLMQLMPGTARGLGVDASNMEQNVMGGVKLLSQLLAMFKGDIQKVLIGYNAGPGRANRPFDQLPMETQKYIPSVARNAAALGLDIRTSGGRGGQVAQTTQGTQATVENTRALELNNEEQLVSNQRTRDMAVEKIKALEAIIQEKDAHDKLVTTLANFNDVVETVGLQVKMGIIEPHEAAKRTVDAANDTMLKFAKQNQQSSMEFAFTAQKMKDATVQIKEYNANKKVMEEQERRIQQVQREGQAILESLRGGEQKYQDQLAALRQLRSDETISIQEYNKAYEDLTMKFIQSSEKYQIAGEMFNIVGDGMSSVFKDLLENGKVTADTFKGIVGSILDVLSKLIIKIIATKIIMSLLGSTGAGLNLGATDIASGGIDMSAFANAPKLATGAMVSRAGVAMLHANEAVIPLKNGAVPVSMSGQGQQGVTIINVTSMDDAQALAKDSNTIINVISRNISERGPVYRAMKSASLK
jgi:TP901 family phage tail tape measure protein